MGAKHIPKDLIPERDRKVAQWLARGETIKHVQELHRKKYKIGISFGKVKAIQVQGPPPQEPPQEPKKPDALVLASPTGLVPARDVSDRLRALIGHVADAMGKEGVIEVAIQEREVVVSFTPDQQLFEV